MSKFMTREEAIAFNEKYYEEGYFKKITTPIALRDNINTRISLLAHKILAEYDKTSSFEELREWITKLTEEYIPSTSEEIMSYLVKNYKPNE